MDYEEFKSRLGELSILDDDIKRRLFLAENSIHYVCVLGKVVSGKYEIEEPISNQLLTVLELVSILQNRGAVRGVDFVVCSDLYGNFLRLGVHTTHTFLSDEDFDKGITRINTRNE